MSYLEKARKILRELEEEKEMVTEEPLPLPFIAIDGGLVIPFSSDPRFHWWRGGQSVETTEREVKRWLN